MRTIITALLAGLFLTACTGAQAAPGAQTAVPVVQPAASTAAPVVETAPAATPAASATAPAPAGQQTCFENICLSPDATVSAQASATRIPASDGGDLPYWQVLPEHIRFDFSGYQIPADAVTPQVFVVPLTSNAGDRMGGSVAALKSLLQQRPDPATAYSAYMPAQGGRSLPLFPQTNAVCAMLSGARYLDFQQGAGVRYLCLFAQGPAPVVPSTLTYVYQGVTDDGQYYVAARFPVTLDGASMAAFPKAPAADASLDTVAQWNRNLAENLRNLPAEAYNPGLEKLDAIVGSISTAAAAVR